MSSWLHIRNTGVNILEILELVSKGRSCLEIRRRFPDLSQRDLARAAAAILDHMMTHVSADILYRTPGSSAIRQPACLHDDTPWTSDEDEELRRLINYRFERSSIARLLRRSEQAVGSRIEQLRNPTR